MNIKFVFLAIVFAGYSAHAAPLSPADRDTVEQQRGRLQQEQLQREELERDQPLSAPAQKSPEPNDAHCFTISTITFSGAEQLSARKKNALTAPFIGKCLSIKSISPLVQEISDEYIKNGFITSRAFLPERDLSQGQLNIQVMEGKLKNIQLDHRNNSMLAMASPGLKGKILNLRDIEQGMEQINRLRQNPVQIEILPAEQPDFSVVNLTATPEFPLSAGVGFDNSGQKITFLSRAYGQWTDDRLYDSERLTLDLDTFNNNGQTLAGGSLALNARDMQPGGMLSAQQDLTVSGNALTVTHTGQLLAGRNLILNTGSLALAGTAKGGQSISLNDARFTSTNGSLITRNGDIALTLTDAQIDGQLTALGSLTLRADRVITGKTAQLQSQQALSLTATQSSDLQGTLAAKGDITVHTATLTHSARPPDAVSPSTHSNSTTTATWWPMISV